MSRWPSPVSPFEPIRAEPMAALGLFLKGLDSPYHSPKSREAWIKLFCRDMGIDYEEVIRLRSEPLP